MHQKYMALAVHQRVLAAPFRNREGALGCCAAAQVSGHAKCRQRYKPPRAIALVDGSPEIR